jgi:hypothetical protein
MTMGHREVKRVPLDFDWPRGEVWEGFLLPSRLSEDKCPDCEHGYSPHAERLHALWYGYIPFDPESTGSVPLRPDTPAVREFAERNVNRAPEFYCMCPGSGQGWSLGFTDGPVCPGCNGLPSIIKVDDPGRLWQFRSVPDHAPRDLTADVRDAAVVREAQRLAKMWNGQWCHHLSQADVNALVEAGRLVDFTSTWSREDGWQKIDPPVIPAAAQVNEWSLRGMGHDSINAHVCIRARCEREGFSDTCLTCGGHGSVEKYPGQRAEAEAWESSEPPAGDGWQLWETTSEGSPKSPVFASAEELAAWCENNATAFADIRWTQEEWLRSFLGGTTDTDSLMIGDASGVHTLGPR